MTTQRLRDAICNLSRADLDRMNRAAGTLFDQAERAAALMPGKIEYTDLARAWVIAGIQIEKKSPKRRYGRPGQADVDRARAAQA